MKEIVVYILIIVSSVFVLSLAKANPTPTPAPTPIKGFIDPCKLQTMSVAHGNWKAANCN